MRSCWGCLELPQKGSDTKIVLRQNRKVVGAKALQTCCKPSDYWKRKGCWEASAPGVCPPPYSSTSNLHALTYRTPRRGTWISWTKSRFGQRTGSGSSWLCSSCWCRWSRAGWAEKMTAGNRGPTPWWCCNRRQCRALWCRWQSQFLQELGRFIWLA